MLEKSLNILKESIKIASLLWVNVTMLIYIHIVIDQYIGPSCCFSVTQIRVLETLAEKKEQPNNK